MIYSNVQHLINSKESWPREPGFEVPPDGALKYNLRSTDK
jgi:hypothetical protein